MAFQAALINWYHLHKRDLPWRKTSDPYIIWLSEIILQQTRVEQGLPYFNKFLENYPTVSVFAKANEEEALKLWQGLGYYSRVRNMLHTAKYVMAHHEGVFPNHYEELIKLKGIGRYTAAAIASLSSGQPKAAVDGNVFRVLARYFGVLEPVNATNGRKIFEEMANKLIENQPAPIYNQAIMEFGALQCKPKKPLCGACPLSIGCFALKQKKVDTLPIKLKLKKVKERFFNYFIMQENDQIWVRKRIDKDIWHNMYDFPMMETKKMQSLEDKEFLKNIKAEYGEKIKIKLLSFCKRQLTHQTIFIQFFALDGYIANFNISENLKMISVKEFKKLPHPKVILDFFEMNR